MCGIVGILDTTGRQVEQHAIRAMCSAVAHRGPDGEGVFCSEGIGLGHRRLAVIDLSPAAEQPMANEDGSIILVFNGEVYNYRELRAQLIALGHTFHSQSDTEVIVHGYEEWGEDVLSRTNGMFALALWDARDNSLVLARDRFGIKPLYYAWAGDRLLFASEVKAIIQAGGWSRRVDSRALVEYFTFQNIFSDRTLFDGIKMLPAATVGRIRREQGTIAFRTYWDIRFPKTNEDLSIKDASVQFRTVLESAVARHLQSDVPLGSYLSGGMDSGTLVALASERVPGLATFTGGFDLSLATGLEMNFDERDSAEAIACKFNTRHYETVLHGGSMRSVLPELVWHLEDLRVGMSYQNYYIAHLASRFVKVALSGAGGDEILAGYPWRYVELLSARDPAEFDTRSFKLWQRLVPVEKHNEFFADDVLSACDYFSPVEVYRQVYGPDAPGGSSWSVSEALHRELYFEMKTFLHGLLVVEDKISSAHSLEVRVPFLDLDLVEFACSLPAHHKLDLKSHALSRRLGSHSAVRSNDGKVILRQAMRDLLPERILMGEKQGFSTPDGSWYRNTSAQYIQDLVLSDRSLARGYFKPEYVRRVVSEHMSGAVNHRLLIWSLACFEWWNRLFLDGTRVDWNS